LEKGKSKIFYGWVILTVAFISIILTYAVRNSFSVFYPAIVEEFGWGRGDTAVMFSLAILVYGLSAPLAGMLIDRFEPRLVLTIGAVVVGTGVALCSTATAQWHFYLIYGLMVAIGLSVMGWNPMTTIVANWFVRKRGLALGVLGAAFGGSMVFGYLSQFLISNFGWRNAYIMIGIAVVVVTAPICAVFMRRSPGGDVELADGVQEKPRSFLEKSKFGNSVHPAVSSKEIWSSTGWTLARALRNRQFWLLFLNAFLLLGVAQQIAVAHQVYFFIDAGYTPLAAATMYSLFGVAFVAGTFCSSLSDYLGREKIFIPACILGAAASSLLFLIDDASQSWMPFLFAICGGLGFGATGPLFYAVVADLFHGKNFGSIQGFIVMGFAMGGAIGPWLAGFLHDNTGDYTVTFIILTCSMVAGAVLMQMVSPGRLSPVQARERH
jgi:sugar phosphate permease